MRIQTARILHRSERFSAAIYVSGVAVECMLRAYIVRRLEAFDERHDLASLFKSAQLESYIEPRRHREINGWLGDVWLRWKNNYRFASDARLRSEFKRLALYRGIRGNILKENARICVEAAFQLCTLGEQQWHSRKN